MTGVIGSRHLDEMPIHVTRDLSHLPQRAVPITIKESAGDERRVTVEG
jgi:hypothetical protein